MSNTKSTKQAASKLLELHPPPRPAARAGRPAVTAPVSRRSAFRRHLSFVLDRAMLITSAVLLVSAEWAYRKSRGLA